MPWTPRDALFGLALVISGTLLTFSVLRWLHHLTNSLPSVPLISLVLGLLPGLMLLAVWLFGINRYGAPWRTLGLLPPRQRRYLFLPWVVLALSLTFAAAYYLVVTAVGIEVLVPEPLPAWVLGDGLYRLFTLCLWESLDLSLRSCSSGDSCSPPSCSPWVSCALRSSLRQSSRRVTSRRASSSPSL